LIRSSESEVERVGLAPLAQSIADARANFMTVRREQERLGFNDSEGIRSRLDRAGRRSRRSSSRT